jgi:hypothetical protein
MNKLTGTLSPEFGTAWLAMEVLSLSTNTLMGPLPREWAGMSRLRTLHL